MKFTSSSVVFPVRLFKFIKFLVISAKLTTTLRSMSGTSNGSASHSEATSSKTSNLANKILIKVNFNRNIDF